MLGTIFHNLWQSGRVNLIFSPDIADGMTEMLKQLLPSFVTCNLSYIRWCLIFFSIYGKIWENKTLSTIFHNSWKCAHLNLIFSPHIADGMN